jgi:hypothetical protein
MICLLVVIAAQFMIFALRPVEGYPGLELPRDFLPGIYPWVAGSLVLVVPVGLILGVRRISPLVRRPAVRGLVAGVVISFWSNAMVLSLPYVGGYPSLPAILLANALVPGKAWGMISWGGILAGNVLFWGSACVAWTVYLNRAAPKRVEPAKA